MISSAIQTLFPFPLNPVCTFHTLVVGEANQRAAEAVLALAENRDPPMMQRATVLLLTGEAGTGKSHLLQAAVAHCRAREGEESAIYLDLAALHGQLQESAEQALSQFLSRYAACRLVAVDDLQEVTCRPVLQEGILYLFNRMRELPDGRMLVASRQSPQWLTGLREDLRSRLLWGSAIALEAASDEMLAAILSKMVEDRQVRCSDELLKFLHSRLPRRIPDYITALERLDEAGLLRKRPLTVPLAKEILHL
ncbi:MAG: ATP-binding protein [Magnetococcales bacterium]|nr:ATP-binding protein [Magnetococcales bacterium]